MGALQLMLVLLMTIRSHHCVMMDLTYVLNEASAHWPAYKDFKMTNLLNFTRPDGLWVFANEVKFAEHTGTHLDAPAHTWLGGIYLHQIPLENLIAPAVVIDVTEKVKTNRDYLLAVEDVLEYESKYGRIPEKAVVFMNTDGQTSYGNPDVYYGSTDRHNISSLHFPSFDGPVIEWLIDNRNINGIGVDRVSLDSAQNPGGKAHKALLSRGRYGLENVANLGKIPQSGATVSVMPMKLERGSGAPARVVAYWGEGVHIPIASGAPRLCSFMLTLITITAALVVNSLC